MGKNIKVEITQEELSSLRDRDFKLQCLENGGVDNWEWYGESMNPYFKKQEAKEKEKEKEEKMSREFESILEILCLGVDEPAGSGCGYGFREEAQDEAFLVFKDLVNNFINIKDD